MAARHRSCAWARLARRAACVIVFLAGPAAAGTEVRVVETWPSGTDVTLARNQNYYLRIAYMTDEPVRIWARPYFRGDAADAGSNPSPVYSGSGEALGWFFLMQDTVRVDEVRITAGDGTGKGTRLLATHPVRIRAGTRAATTAEPAWVTELRSDSEQRIREAYEQGMNTPASAGDRVFIVGFMLAVLGIGVGGLAAPLWALRRWDGGWRLAAALPLLVIGFVVLRIVLDTARDPTSHNLWPFEILQAGVLSVVIIAVLLLARKLLGATSR